MKRHLMILLLCSLGGHCFGAERKLTCNERMRHGPRGVAKGLAALAGCAALGYLGREMWNISGPLRVSSEIVGADKQKEALQNVGYTAIAMSALGYVSYLLGASSHESLTIFFTDDPDEDLKEIAQKLKSQVIED